MVDGEERLDGRDRVLTTLAHRGPLSRAELARRTRLLALHRRTGLVAGVDLGKAHARVAVADLAHRVVAERDAELEPDTAWREQVRVVLALLADVLEQAEASMSQVVAVALGLPGPYRPGGSVDPAILPGWAGVDPERELAAAFATPVVIGSGVAGELGHVSVDPRGPRCRCGNRGCLELLAGGSAVLARVPAARTLADVATMAAAGDDRAVAAVGQAGDLLGRALGGVVNLLDPQRVILGGDLAGAGEALLAPLRAALADTALASAREDLTVVTGLHGARAEVLGAVAMALRCSRPLST